jgi:hypothetical protein
MTDEQRAAEIAALIREREVCELRGLTDRAEQITVSLRNLGVLAALPHERAERRPRNRNAVVEKR